MARPKSWIPRISHILQYLEEDTAVSYKRAEVEKLFSISASQAKELMSVAGAESGLELSVTRINLLRYVKYSPEADAALREIDRRKKLALRLKAAEEENRLRARTLRVTKDAEWTRFVDIPDVSVAPGMIQVAFTAGDPTSALDALFRFIKAVGNDFDSFEEMCGVPRTRKAS